jgi:hypothetical protein
VGKLPTAYFLKTKPKINSIITQQEKTAGT